LQNGKNIAVRVELAATGQHVDDLKTRRAPNIFVREYLAESIDAFSLSREHHYRTPKADIHHKTQRI
jgi:hypothetical protein